VLIRLSVYAVIVFTIFVAAPFFSILSPISKIKDQYIAVVLFGVFVAMLFVDVKSNIHKGLGHDSTYRRASILSFWIGIMWGMVMSFAGGIPYNKDIPHAIASLVGVIVVGGIFGLVGRGLAALFVSAQGR